MEGARRSGALFIYLALPVVFLIVPTSYIESFQSVCFFKGIFGENCPGCGMTRAVSCVFHGAFMKAYGYNRLVAVVFPLLAYVWLKGLVRMVTKSWICR